ncbi:MAG: methylmalonyl-CoA mutase family protein, partial [Synergistaceae bacterium]|nr:methylmalonyl-CoA mutase family protein [Synergistaceae bacterium]
MKGSKKSHPDFTKIQFKTDGSQGSSAAGWEKRFREETGRSPSEMISRTMEQIDVKPLYTEEDYKGLKHLGYMPGLPPFLRGPYPTMYVTRPWTVRQYAGFSTAEESNAFYRRNL